MVCSVPLLFQGMEGPITAKIGAVVCGGLEWDWVNEQRWTGEHLRKWGDYSVWAFKGNLLVAFKLMLTLAVQLSWACARRSFSDEEKLPTLSFSDRSRSVDLSRCETNLTNREDRKSDTLRPIRESSNSTIIRLTQTDSPTPSQKSTHNCGQFPGKLSPTHLHDQKWTANRSNSAS